MAEAREITVGTGTLTGELVRHEDGRFGILIREKNESDLVVKWGESYESREGDLIIFFTDSEAVSKVINLLNITKDYLSSSEKQSAS